MKIAVIGTRGFPHIQGGVEKHCEALYPNVAASGHEIVVFRRRPYVREVLSASGFKNIVFLDAWTPRNQYFEAIVHSFWAALICLFKKPDLVHLHNIGPGLVLPLLKLGGIKTVVTYHSTNYLHDKWNWIAQRVLKLGEIFVLSLADAVIFVSQDKLQTVSSERMFHIPNGVCTPGFTASTEFLDEIGVKPRQYILAVSRLTPEKALHDLVEAYLRMDAPPHLVIVGGADHESSYTQNLYRMVSQDPRIIMTGYLEGTQLQQIYSHAGLFVLPSHHEGFPLVLLEALSYGLTVLASDIPANKQVGLSSDGYFRRGDINDLRDRMVRLLASAPDDEGNRSLCNRMERKYDWVNIAEKTMSVYNYVFIS